MDTTRAMKFGNRVKILRKGFYEGFYADAVAVVGDDVLVLLKHDTWEDELPFKLSELEVVEGIHYGTNTN